MPGIPTNPMSAVNTMRPPSVDSANAAAGLPFVLAHAKESGDFSPGLLRIFYSCIQSYPAQLRWKSICEFIQIAVENADPKGIEPDAKAHQPPAESPRATISDVEKFRSIAQDMPIGDKQAVLHFIDSMYERHPLPKAMKWLSVFSQMADNRPARGPVVFRIPLPTEKQLDDTTQCIPSPESPELQALYRELSRTIDANPLEPKIPRELLEKFFAIGIDVDSDPKTGGRENLNAEQKTQLIRELMTLHHALLHESLRVVSMPEPIEADVIKLRAIAKSLSPEQRQLIIDDYATVFRHAHTGVHTHWSAVYCQIFGEFPILPLTFHTRARISRIPGFTFTAMDVPTPALDPGKPKIAPFAVIAALHKDLAEAATNQKFPAALLKEFYGLIDACDPEQKNLLILGLMKVSSKNSGYGAPDAKLADAKKFRAIGESLSVEDKKALLDAVRGYYDAAPGAKQMKWLSVIVQMTHDKPMREPISLRMALPGEEELRAVGKIKMPATEEEIEKSPWKSLLQLQPLYNELAPAIDARNMTRALLNKFYAVAKNLAPDLRTEVILDLMQVSSICEERSTAPASVEDVENLRAITAGLSPAQRQAIKDKYQAIQPLSAPDQRQMRWAIAYCQMLDASDAPILPLNAMTFGLISEMPKHPFFDVVTKKKTSPAIAVRSNKSIKDEPSAAELRRLVSKVEAALRIRHFDSASISRLQQVHTDIRLAGAMEDLPEDLQTRLTSALDLAARIQARQKPDSRFALLRRRQLL